MYYRISILTLALLSLGCATKFELIGRTDFNPIYEWTPSKKVFILPYSVGTDSSSNFQIEAKLVRIASAAGSKAELSFVDSPEHAEAFMFVKYNSDTVSYVTSSKSYTYGNSLLWNNSLTDQISISSYDWTITIPSFEKQDMYITVELWLLDKQKFSTKDLEESFVRMVSYATRKLGGRDHNKLTYDLLVACIKSIPGTNQDFDKNVHIVDLVLEANWLSGIRTREYYGGRYINPPKPFKWDENI